MSVWFVRIRNKSDTSSDARDTERPTPEHICVDKYSLKEWERVKTEKKGDKQAPKVRLQWSYRKAGPLKCPDLSGHWKLKLLESQRERVYGSPCLIQPSFRH